MAKGNRRWWTRDRGLDADVHGAWVASLEHLEPQARMLAWTTTADGVCVGSVGYLSFNRPAGEADDWTHVGWHEIDQGTWNAETDSLQWRLHSGRRGSVTLTDPGRLPELFRERVAASIVVEQFLVVPGSRGGVVLTGRRNLADPDAPLSWHASPGRGVSWSTVGARGIADDGLAELRGQYDPAV